MCDLMEAMGLQKGSIYKVWDDKRALFQAALARYLDQGFGRLDELARSSDDPVEALEALLEHFAGICGGSQRGCFALNTVVELGPHDQQAAALLAAHHERLEGLLARLIRRAQREQRLRTDRPASELAHFLFVVISGMLTRSKASMTKARARRTAELALEALR